MVTSRKGDRRSLIGWCSYDWASSAYATTVLVAVLPNYFADVVAAEGVTIGGHTLRPTSLWSFSVATAAFLGFAAAPLLGAIADFSAAKKRFLLIFAWCGAVAGSALYFSRSGDVWQTLLLFILAQFAFISANIFYNAFLPQLVTEERYDRVSGYGFAAGYVGGGLQFGLSLVVVKWHAAFGLEKDAAARVVMLCACAWWAVFSSGAAILLRERPAALALPKRYRAQPGCLRYITAGLRQTLETSRRVKRLKQLLLFLVAYLLFNDGMQTVITMATVYGTVELGLGREFLMLMLLVIQGAAMLGALFFGWLAGRLGTKPTLMLTLVIWTGAVVWAYFVYTGAAFFALGVVIGFVLGGAPALSRSFYSALIPTSASAEFFGFYTVFSKFAAILGPLVFGLIDSITGSARGSIVSLAVFFIGGLVLLSFVNEEKARQTRDALERELRGDADAADDSTATLNGHE